MKKNLRSIIANVILLAIAFGLFQACVPPASAVEINLNLKWTDNATNEEGFKVYMRTSPTAQFTVIEVVDVPNVEQFTFSTDVNGGEVFQFVVSAWNTWLGAEQESGFSNIATFTVPTNPGPPTAPSSASVILGSVK